MTLTPELLLEVSARRVRAVRPDLFAEADLSSPAALHAARAELADRQRDGVSVVCVIGALRLADWIRESCRFALSLPAESAERWRRDFTRTVFLAGSPASLRDRFTCDHLAPDGAVAWTGPAPEGATAGLRRLLKTFQGGRPQTGLGEPAVVELPAGDGPMERWPVHRELHIATARVTVASALVQLNHLLAEAVMDRVIGPGDRLGLRFVPHLTGPADAFAALRVDTDPGCPQRLRPYAALTTALTEEI